MNDAPGGKGPGYALLWGGVVLLFGGMVTWGAVDGVVRWVVALLVDGGLVAAFAALMATATWSRD